MKLKVTHRSSDMLHLVFGTSFILHHSEFLILIIQHPLSYLHLNVKVQQAMHYFFMDWSRTPSAASSVSRLQERKAQKAVNTL